MGCCGNNPIKKAIATIDGVTKKAINIVDGVTKVVLQVVPEYYAKRYETCLKCDSSVPGIWLYCTKCGCGINGKCRVASEVCPRGFWKAEVK